MACKGLVMKTYGFSVQLQTNGRMVISPHIGLSTKVYPAILVGVEELVEYVNQYIEKEEN